MNGLFRPEWSTLKKLIFLQSMGGETWNTVTGNPVSFTAKAAPLRKLEVAFSPVQDLNGYDSPWPAGGGANKYDSSAAVANERFNSTGTASASGTTRSDYIPCISGASYYALNVHGSAVMAGVYWYDSSKTYISHDLISGTSPASGVVTAPANAAFMGLNIPNESATSAAVNYPSSVTTYSPYSNECPISGWDSLTVYHSGADTSDPRSISISLGQTVYSGYVDVVTGVGEIDLVAVTFDGTETYNNYANVVVCRKAVTSGSGNDIICDRTSYPNVAWATNARVNFQFNKSAFNVQDDTGLKALFAEWAGQGSPITVVYKLETPIPIQLTPQEVQSLAGDNTMWSNANQPITVEYRKN